MNPNIVRTVTNCIHRVDIIKRVIRMGQCISNDLISLDDHERQVLRNKSIFKDIIVFRYWDQFLLIIHNASGERNKSSRASVASLISHAMHHTTGMKPIDVTNLAFLVVTVGKIEVYLSSMDDQNFMANKLLAAEYSVGETIMFIGSEDKLQYNEDGSIRYGNIRMSLLGTHDSSHVYTTLDALETIKKPALSTLNMLFGSFCIKTHLTTASEYLKQQNVGTSMYDILGPLLKIRICRAGQILTNHTELPFKVGDKNPYEQLSNHSDCISSFVISGHLLKLASGEYSLSDYDEIITKNANIAGSKAPTLLASMGSLSKNRSSSIMKGGLAAKSLFKSVGLAKHSSIHVFDQAKSTQLIYEKYGSILKHGSIIGIERNFKYNLGNKIGYFHDIIACGDAIVGDIDVNAFTALSTLNPDLVNSLEGSYVFSILSGSLNKFPIMQDISTDQMVQLSKLLKLHVCKEGEVIIKGNVGTNSTCDNSVSIYSKTTSSRIDNSKSTSTSLSNPSIKSNAATATALASPKAKASSSVGDCVYLIVKGDIEEVISTDGTTVRTLQKKGDLIGEVSLIINSRVSTCTSLCSTIVLQVPKVVYNSYFNNNKKITNYDYSELNDAIYDYNQYVSLLTYCKSELAAENITFLQIMKDYMHLCQRLEDKLKYTLSSTKRISNNNLNDVVLIALLSYIMQTYIVAGSTSEVNISHNSKVETESDYRKLQAQRGNEHEKCYETLQLCKKIFSKSRLEVHNLVNRDNFPRWRSSIKEAAAAVPAAVVPA